MPRVGNRGSGRYATPLKDFDDTIQAARSERAGTDLQVDARQFVVSSLPLKNRERVGGIMGCFPNCLRAVTLLPVPCGNISPQISAPGDSAINGVLFCNNYTAREKRTCVRRDKMTKSCWTDPYPLCHTHPPPSFAVTIFSLPNDTSEVRYQDRRSETKALGVTVLLTDNLADFNSFCVVAAAPVDL